MGSLYGTTISGGTYGYGTVFGLTTNGALTTLFSFDYSDGAYPQTALAQGVDGSFYGTTADGGTNLVGTVFRITTNGDTLTTRYFFSTILTETRLLGELITWRKMAVSTARQRKGESATTAPCSE